MRFSEAFKMALQALRANKLRSFLTLVGIIAGVASIIAVMTGISVIQGTMEKEMSVLGVTTFQAQRMPRGGFNNNIDWRKMQQRPPVTVGNADAIRDNVDTVDLVGAELWHFGSQASYRGKDTGGQVVVFGGTPEYPANNTHFVELGRNLTNEDVDMKRKVAVIGFAIAETLFPFTDPIDKVIKADGYKYRVIGVFEEKKSAFGGGFDNYIMIPISLSPKVYGTRDARGNPASVNITINAKSPELLQDAIAETKAVLRADRGVDPREEDNFYVFSNDSNVKEFNQATQGVKAGAFVIGMVALLVAGIGIMNIMLVSVTERTKEIGIRKALGAKRKDILRQFLLEAVVLCNLGGVVGVMVGFGLGNIMTLFTDFAVSIPLDWAVIGLVFCSLVGLFFGLWPALKASRLAPIDALGYE